MPLYEYQCDACSHRFERIQKFSDPPIETCPQCGGTVRKLLSSPAIQFKGSGWYITDYARKGGGGKSEDGKGASNTESSSGSDSTKASSTTTTSSETKTSSESKPASGGSKTD
jgi:putative FmdB family regulatory protein